MKKEQLNLELEVAIGYEVAQAAYHQKTGGFVENQRLFTINTLRNGVI